MGMNSNSIPCCLFANVLEKIDFSVLPAGGSGGAIYCESSTLIINSEYSIFANNSAKHYGGAIAL